MPKTFLYLSVLLLSGRAVAQYNDSVFHHIGYASTGIINRTNTGSSYLLTNTFKFNVVKKSISLNSSSSWMYGEQNKNLTNNDFTSTLDFNLYKTLPHFYYWGLASYDKSFSLKIRNRLQAGLGVAYSIIDRKDAYLGVSDGILYEFSDLSQDPLVKDKYETFRNSFRLRFRWVIKEIIVLDGTNFLQNSLKDKDDYIIKATNSLSVKLRKWLSLTTSVTYNKLNRTGRDNLLVNYGVSVEKYF